MGAPTLLERDCTREALMRRHVKKGERPAPLAHLTEQDTPVAQWRSGSSSTAAASKHTGVEELGLVGKLELPE